MFEASILIHVLDKRFKRVSWVSSGECHPTQVIMGDDLRLRTLRKPSGLWRSGQHVLHLQSQGKGWERQGHA